MKEMAYIVATSMELEGKRGIMKKKNSCRIKMQEDQITDIYHFTTLVGKYSSMSSR